MQWAAPEWGQPIGRQVRLGRGGIDRDFEGKLELVALPNRIDRRLSLKLKMGTMMFLSEEVDALGGI